MTSTRRLWVCAVAVAAALLASVLAAPGAFASSASSFVSLVNSSRSSAGLHAYAGSSELNAVAQGQAQRMASAHRLYHNPGLASQVTNWKYVGENVGYGPDVNTLFSAFMHSPEHKANILDHDFTQIGVGAVTSGGTLWVSMVFRDPLHSTTSTPSGGHSSTTTKKSSTTHRSMPSRSKAAAHAKSAATLRAAAAQLHDPGLVCVATAAAADRVRGVSDLDRSARLLESAQLVVRGFQCGRALPMTGVLDDATLHALTLV
jgi:hypothetical protein